MNSEKTHTHYKVLYSQTILGGKVLEVVILETERLHKVLRNGSVQRLLTSLSVIVIGFLASINVKSGKLVLTHIREEGFDFRGFV